MSNLWDLITRSAYTGTKLQNEYGGMPEGHNGPHNDPETPVRNTAHWIITFLKSYEHTGEEVFKKAAIRSADYLTGKDARPMNAAFYCRKNPEKDFSNGLIGQAWAIEALAQAFNQLKSPVYGKIAKEVFLMHPFNEDIGLWGGLNIDGSYGSINLTFNQQLWFAACGALLIRNESDANMIEYRVKGFLDNLPKNLYVHKNGLISHLVRNREIYGNTLENALKRDALMRQREIGYHSFILYAFSLLKKNLGPDYNDFWNTIDLRKMIRYVTTESYLRELEGNRYSFLYNPVGFELGFALDVFSEYDITKNTEIPKWVNEQLRRHWSKEERLMNKNTIDSNTLAARIYEATRLPNMKIDLED